MAMRPGIPGLPCRATSDGHLVATIWDVAVQPVLQRSGLGTAMMERLMVRLIEEDGIPLVALYAEPGVVRLYKASVSGSRHGWRSALCLSGHTHYGPGLARRGLDSWRTHPGRRAWLSRSAARPARFWWRGCRAGARHDGLGTLERQASSHSVHAVKLVRRRARPGMWVFLSLPLLLSHAVHSVPWLCAGAQPRRLPELPQSAKQTLVGIHLVRAVGHSRRRAPVCMIKPMRMGSGSQAAEICTTGFTGTVAYPHGCDMFNTIHILTDSIVSLSLFCCFGWSMTAKAGLHDKLSH